MDHNVEVARTTDNFRSQAFDSRHYSMQSAVPSE
jgi:hypothetical protein